MFLTTEEVAALTGYARSRKRQRERLAAMHIPVIERPDGTFVVLRAVVIAHGGGRIGDTPASGEARGLAEELAAS